MTTSWTRFVHGDVVGSFTAHALGPITYVLFTLSAIAALVSYARGYRWNTYNPQLSRAIGAIAIVFVGFGIVRMAVVSDYRTPRERAIMGIEESVRMIGNGNSTQN